MLLQKIYLPPKVTNNQRKSRRRDKQYVVIKKSLGQKSSARATKYTAVQQHFYSNSAISHMITLKIKTLTGTGVHIYTIQACHAFIPTSEMIYHCGANLSEQHTADQ